MNRQSFTDVVSSKLVTVFSAFGSRQYPVPNNLKSMLLEIASFEFLVKPAAAISSINQGVPAFHASFWKQMGVSGLLAIYKAQSVSCAKVLVMLDEEEGGNANENRVLGYLRQFVGSMNSEDLRIFLRFCTGSTICTADKITVSFNT